MTNKIESRLEELNITLPEVGTPPGNFVAFIRTGNLLYVSGQIPIRDGEIVTGSVGKDFDVEEAAGLARLATSFALAVAKKALPSLDDIKGSARNKLDILGFKCAVDWVSPIEPNRRCSGLQ